MYWVACASQYVGVCHVVLHRTDECTRVGGGSRVTRRLSGHIVAPEACSESYLHICAVISVTPERVDRLSMGDAHSEQLLCVSTGANPLSDVVC